MSDTLWTVPNIITITRFLLIVPMSVLLLDENVPRLYTAAIILVAASTDALDGYFARKLNQVSDVGKVLDPIADKAAIAAVCVILVIQNALPLWFLAAVLVRDVSILAGGLYIKKSENILFQSNRAGKWTVGLLALFIILKVLGYPELEPAADVLMPITVFMLAVSFILYSRRFTAVIRNRGQRAADNHI